MNRTTPLLKINGTLIPKLKSYKVGRNKLYKEAERSMSGELKATLIGIFPKIEIEIGYLTENEMQQVTRLLDKAFFNVEYYDQRTKATYTTKCYANDYQVEIYDKQKAIYKPFSVHLIPFSRRIY